MTVNGITLENFRSYETVKADFSENINIITGMNAQGKTNLIEAIFYLTCGRSFRTRSDRELINFNADSAFVKLDITSGGRDQVLEAYIQNRRRKTILINGVKQKSVSGLSGKLTAVLFCPSDLSMIREGAYERRRLMDQCLCQMRPKYAEALAEFSRIYDHKSRILKDYHEKPALLDTLDDFNERLAHFGAVLIYYRAAFIALLNERAREIHSDFSGGAEELFIKYETVKTIEEPLGKKPAELVGPLLEHLASHRSAELETGTCLSGPHKDDLLITINGKNAKSFASQGQIRTAALSVKMAERSILASDTGESPVLLLDDVLSELDSDRQDFVLNRVGGGQVFITCCEDDRIFARTGGRVFTVHKGHVERI